MANLSLIFLVLFLFINTSQTTYAINDTHNNGVSFNLIHHDLISSSYQSNVTVEEKTEKIIQLSQARVESLEHRLSSGNTNTSDDFLGINEVIRPPLYHHFGQSSLLVEVGIGTFAGSRPPYKKYYLGLDTASGPIWTQCQGCDPCFPQRDPVFPRHQSQTYRALPCNQCPRGTPCVRDHCQLDHSYGDGTRIHGIVAKETFTFGSSSSGSLMTMQNLQFACVIHTQNFVLSRVQNNIASGLFGMNRHASSFMGQVGAHLGGRFSYCFITFDYQGRRPPMFLRFGNDIPPLSSSNLRHTPLIRGQYPYYYLDLRAISIGSQRLNIDPSVFQIRSGGSGGCIIDSAAGATHLMDVAYTEFERVLMQQIVRLNPQITMTSRNPQLCYRQPRPRTRTEFPKVTFHFANNADFVIEQEAYMVGFGHPNPQVYCLLMQRSNRFTLFGASQQVNHRIVFDTSNSRLYFTKTNCISNN